MSVVDTPPPTVREMRDQQVKFYFERGIGPMEAVTRTGLTYQIVHSRYERWFKQIEHRRDKKFLIEQERGKSQALLALDKQITELLSIQQQIVQRVGFAEKNAKDEKRVMTNNEIQPTIRSKLSWLIADITDKKASLQMTPATATRVREEVSEYIDSLQKQSYTQEIKSDGR